MIKIPRKSLLENPKIDGLLGLALQLKVINRSLNLLIDRGYLPYIDLNEQQEEEYETITVFSVGARDALTKAIYGKHAKNLFPSTGIFDINDIENSIRRYGRYASISYPDVKDETSFHQVEARSFYLALHDELHRRLISTIPNPVYDALLHSIDVIREKTNRKWSKEIWDTLDMEVGIFLQETQTYRDATDPKALTECFARLLNAKVYSEDRPMGLFTASMFVETTWLLMIDMVLNKQKWEALSIDIHSFPKPSVYSEMIEFIEKFRHLIEQESSPEKQVAIMMAQYLNLPIGSLDNIKFEKHGQYLQLVSEGKSLFVPKAAALIPLTLSEQAELNTVLNKQKFDFKEFSEEEKLILFRRASHLMHYIDLNKISLKELVSLTDEEFIAVIDFAIINLIERSRLTLQEFKELYELGLVQIINNNTKLKGLILEGLLTVSDLKRLDADGQLQKLINSDSEMEQFTIIESFTEIKDSNLNNNVKINNQSPLTNNSFFNDANKSDNELLNNKYDKGF
ncbi:hypothetical protein ACNVED_02920 [Legionella sp. D16C41]|uniref:hypothetical protein n=1 Tax=Legionella sp. D16C41 TaxID=3402688 RepID=UPI003AF74521